MFSVSFCAPEELINQHINKRRYMHLTVGSRNPNSWFVTPIMYGTALILFSASSSDGFLAKKILSTTASIKRGCWRKKHHFVTYILVLLGKIIQLS